MKPVNRLRETRKALSRLIDAFGADILVTLNPPVELRPIERLKLRRDADERVESCTACPLHASKGGSTEVPLAPFWGNTWRAPRAGRVAVVVDAPTMQEHTAGELGHGPLFGTVRGELRGNGVDPGDVAYLTSVACTPIVEHRAGRSATDPHVRRELRRTPPQPEHAAICVDNLMQSLAAADVDYVLLLGGQAVRAWRRDLSIEQAAGHWFLWQSRWMVFVAEHPSVVLSARKSISATQWRDQLTKFCQGVHGRVGLEVLSGGCIRDNCTEAMYAWDDDGVPWCHEHFKLGKATRDGRKVKTVDTTQGEMFDG